MAGFTLAGQPDTITFIDAGGYFNRDAPLLLLIPGAAAVRACFFNYRAFAAAIAANGGIDKLSEETALDTADLTGAVT